MADFRTGAVILINFPFTDGTSAKKRPALVLLDSGDSDLLLARITTQPSDSPFDCELEDWVKAGLKAPSFVRLHKLATLEKKLVQKQLGLLSAADFQRVLETLQKVNRQISQP
ncbi:MAG TPA: type II toxin-antitoxin system PemK/MazF family toxin [Verrucomicrobiae bacterium]